MCLCLLERSRLVLGKRGVVQPSNVHFLTELLTRSGVVRTLRRQSLPEVLRDGTVNGILRRLTRLERGQLCLPSKLASRKTLGKLLRLRLVGKLTRLKRKTRVLGDSSVLRLGGLLACAKACQSRLVGKPTQSLRLAQALLTRLHIELQTL